MIEAGKGHKWWQSWQNNSGSDKMGGLNLQE